jgi:hypothetical protein
MLRPLVVDARPGAIALAAALKDPIISDPGQGPTDPARGVMRRHGIAAGLCIALGGTRSDNGTLCKWPRMTEESGGRRRRIPC